MERCEICNGRMMQAMGGGTKCSNPRCKANKSQTDSSKEVKCKCGEPMSYSGLNSLGEPRYECNACGATTKL